MAQRRDAPAFQEYAASMMARTEYRVMSLEARGLLYSLRLECWVNGRLPSKPDILARVLGFPPEQIERALPEVASFIETAGDELRCPELDDYRAHLEDRRLRQSEGGRAGAALTNRTRKRSRAGDLTGEPRLGRESLVQQRPIQPSKAKAPEFDASHDEWRR